MREALTGAGRDGFSRPRNRFSGAGGQAGKDLLSSARRAGAGRPGIEPHGGPTFVGSELRNTVQTKSEQKGGRCTDDHDRRILRCEKRKETRGKQRREGEEIPWLRLPAIRKSELERSCWKTLERPVFSF